MPVNTQTQSSDSLFPPEFLSFIKFTAALGFFAALALTTALVYKGIEKLIGPEEAKKYRWVVAVVDAVVLLVFIFIYLIFF